MNKRRPSLWASLTTNQTTGLHVKDIKKLLAILQKLVNSGNTVVVM